MKGKEIHSRIKAERGSRQKIGKVGDEGATTQSDIPFPTPQGNSRGKKRQV